MATRRLTDSMRRAILTVVIEHGFKARQDGVRRELKEFGDRIYNDLYTPKARNLMESLPNGALMETTSLYFQLRASYTEIIFSQSRRVFWKHEQGRAAAVYDASHAFSETYVAIKGREHDLEKEVNSVKDNVRFILSAAPSIKRLLEEWPEVEPFLRDYVPEAQKALVDPRSLRKLNKDLGLPVTQETL